jgi:hypothetical protein
MTMIAEALALVTIAILVVIPVAEIITIVAVASVVTLVPTIVPVTLGVIPVTRQMMALAVVAVAPGALVVPEIILPHGDKKWVTLALQLQPPR